MQFTVDPEAQLRAFQRKSFWQLSWTARRRRVAWAIASGSARIGSYIARNASDIVWTIFFVGAPALVGAAIATEHTNGIGCLAAVGIYGVEVAVAGAFFFYTWVRDTVAAGPPKE